jgi:hypothetical protein
VLWVKILFHSTLGLWTRAPLASLLRTPSLRANFIAAREKRARSLIPGVAKNGTAASQCRGTNKIVNHESPDRKLLQPLMPLTVDGGNWRGGGCTVAAVTRQATGCRARSWLYDGGFAWRCLLVSPWAQFAFQARGKRR